MISLIPFRSEWAEPYLTAALAATRGRAPRRGRAGIRRSEEIELLKQTIALCDAAVNVAPEYPLPPDDAPLRAALTQAVQQMRADYCPNEPEGSLEQAFNTNSTWNRLSRHASARLASHESRLSRPRKAAGPGPKG